MSWSFWLIAAVILMIVEIATPGVFFFACLAFGAFFAAIAAFFNLPAWISWAVFLSVSVLSIYFLRPFALKFFRVNTTRSNVDAYIGQRAFVTEAITPPALGMVKIEGEMWRAEAREAIPANTFVEVVSVKGTRLEVKKQEV